MAGTMARPARRWPISSPAGAAAAAACTSSSAFSTPKGPPASLAPRRPFPPTLPPAATPILLGRRLIFVDVHLGDSDFALERRCQFLEGRCDRLAGAAPLRPEIDQHRAGGLEHVGIEAGIGDLVGDAVGDVHGHAFGLRCLIEAWSESRKGRNTRQGESPEGNRGRLAAGHPRSMLAL